MTLVGNGAERSESGEITSTANSDLFIDCSSQVRDLTLQDARLNYNDGSSNAVNFAGKGNKLSIKGTVLFDYNVGFNAYAAVHVGETIPSP